MNGHCWHAVYNPYRGGPCGRGGGGHYGSSLLNRGFSNGLISHLCSEKIEERWKGKRAEKRLVSVEEKALTPSYPPVFLNLYPQRNRGTPQGGHTGTHTALLPDNFLAVFCALLLLTVIRVVNHISYYNISVIFYSCSVQPILQVLLTGH
jgi:hypothetical protein